MSKDRNNLKILYLMLDGFPTFRPDVIALFGKYLVRHDILSDIVTIENPGIETGTKEWSAGRIFVYPKPKGKFHELIGWFLFELKTLLMIRKGDYDAIQVRDKSFAALAALMRARSLGIPFYYWMSFPMGEFLEWKAKDMGFKSGMLRWASLAFRGRIGTWVLYKIVLPRADHIFVQSDKMAEGLIKRKFDRAKITAVPMCIDPDRFPEPQTNTKNSRLKIPTVAYLGTLDKIRRIDMLVNAVHAARAQIPNLKFLIIGDSVEREDRIALEQQIDRLKMSDCVEITGWLTVSQARERLNEADLALAICPPDPLLDVGTPTKLVEYLALCKPVIANNHPDQSKVINESGGGFCVAFGQDSFAKAIIHAFESGNLLLRMGKKGRDYIMTHRNYEVTAEKLSQIYHKMH